MIFALQVFVDEVRQELFEDARGIFHLPLQCCHDERSHVASVTHREGALCLQRADEGQQEVLFRQHLSEQCQGLLHVSRDLEKRGQRLGWGESVARKRAIINAKISR